jgi:putative spermidine/putrescine transport system substrate-binding protein
VSLTKKGGWSGVVPVVGVILAAIAAPARAQPTLVFAGYGGSSETAFRERILPPFEQAHGVRIDYVAGSSATNLARLQAQRTRPEVDVALLDDGPMQQAIGLGLCDPLPAAPVLDELYPLAAAGGDGRAVGIGIVATGLAYNTETFRKLNRPPPQSWAELGDPELSGQVLVPSLSNSYGLHALLALARTEGGDARNIEPGFRFMSDAVAPGVLSFETSSAKISEMFQTGEAALAVWGNGRTQALADTGFPIAFATPKEGAVALVSMACPVAGSDVAELSRQLILYLLSPEVQAALAEQAGWGPVNRQVKLAPAVAGRVIYGTEAIDRLIRIDWSEVNAARPDWTRRWDREIER